MLRVERAFWFSIGEATQQRMTQLLFHLAGTTRFRFLVSCCITYVFTVYNIHVGGISIHIFIGCSV